jgi:NADH-quinone oxidoreductase subunit H
MISYELSLGLAVIPVFLLIGQLRLTEVVRYQIENGWLIAPFVGDWANPYKWLLAIPMLISFAVFTVAIFAETNRLPFDLPEAETELVGGYHTEYGSMKFGLFFLGEYINMILMSAMTATLFLGGWQAPTDAEWLAWVPGPIWLILKIVFILFLFLWVRATFPRYRYDQLMRLGWKIFLPFSLLWVVLVSGWLMLTRYDGLGDHPATALVTDAETGCSMEAPVSQDGLWLELDDQSIEALEDCDPASSQNPGGSRQ